MCYLDRSSVKQAPDPGRVYKALEAPLCSYTAFEILKHPQKKLVLYQGSDTRFHLQVELKTQF